MRGRGNKHCIQSLDTHLPTSTTVARTPILQPQSVLINITDIVRKCSPQTASRNIEDMCTVLVYDYPMDRNGQ